MIPHIMEYYVAAKKNEAAVYPYRTIINKYLLMEKNKNGTMRGRIIHIYIYIYTHTHTHTYIYTHLHKYTHISYPHQSIVCKSLKNREETANSGCLPRG